MDNSFPNGIRWEGTDGWVFCARGAEQVTASDPNAAQAKNPRQKALDASNPAILTAPYKDGDKRWMPSTDHYLNWLEAVAKQQDPIAPVDQAAKSLQACAVGWIADEVGAQAGVGPGQGALPQRRRRAEDGHPRAAVRKYDVSRVMKKAGLA